jgi:hypothetical protein
LWGLPGAAVETAVFHHRLECYPNPSFCPAVAVNVADAIYYLLHPDQHFGAPTPNMAYLEKAGLDHRFDHWVAPCKELQM